MSTACRNNGDTGVFIFQAIFRSICPSQACSKGILPKPNFMAHISSANLVTSGNPPGNLRSLTAAAEHLKLKFQEKVNVASTFVDTNVPLTADIYQN